MLKLSVGVYHCSRCLSGALPELSVVAKGTWGQGWGEGAHTIA